MNNNRTEEQIAAARHPADKLAIIACPGSGKTTTLTDRVAIALNEQGIFPGKVGIVTYTNAAARVLRQRIDEKCPADRDQPLGHCGTLHSLIFAIVRCEHKQRGLKPPTILPEEATAELLTQAAEAMGYKGSAKKLTECYEASKYQLHLQTMNDPAQLAVAHYRRMLATEGFYDYNSILVEGLRLITEGHEITKAAIASIEHLYVDEFQDAGKVDIEIYLSWPARTKTFVGDPNQSIFGFRGAYRNTLLKLEKEGFTVVNLTSNFRCSPSITAAANRLIVYNYEPGFRPMESNAHEYGDVELIQQTSQEALRTAVSQLIKSETTNFNTPETEIAVLCRTNKIAESYRTALAQAGFTVETETALVSSQEWPQAKLWLSFLACPSNNLILRLLLSHAALPTTELLAAIVRDQSGNEAMGLVPPESPVMTVSGLLNTGRQFNIASSCLAYIEKEWGGLTPGAALAALRGNPDLIPAKRSVGVAVVTAHSAKGREWDTVVVTELTEGIWPLGSCAKIPEELKEERRLAYVAVTRARKRLYLGTCSSVIPPWGRRPEPASASRFIREALAE